VKAEGNGRKKKKRQRGERRGGEFLYDSFYLGDEEKTRGPGSELFGGGKRPKVMVQLMRGMEKS